MSGELLARFTAYPKMQAMLSPLPPKMLNLASNRAPQVVEIQAGDLAAHVSMVESRIRSATFTSMEDNEIVPTLYEDYIDRIVGVLQTTLSLSGADEYEAAAALRLPAVPVVSVPDTDPLCLADGQLLLLLPDTE